MARGYRIEIVSNGDTSYWWRIKAGNNEIVCSSETYTTAAAARKTVAAMASAVAERLKEVLLESVACVKIGDNGEETTV